MATVEDFKKQREYIEPLITGVTTQQTMFKYEHL